MRRGIEGIVCAVFGFVMSFNSMASDVFIDEAESIKFGSDVCNGTVCSEKEMAKALGKKYESLEVSDGANLVKNIYLAYLYAGEPMVDFRAKCLDKMLSIASSVRGLTGSNNYKVTQLLYYSQVINGVLSNKARDDIIGSVIDRLSSAVNGDQESARKLLNEFYGILRRDEHFECYVP